MRLGGTSEEVFRFSVVRNPEPVSASTLRDAVVPIVPESPGEEYRFCTALLALGRDATRRAILDTARRLMDAPESKERLRNLRTPLWRYVEMLQALPTAEMANASGAIQQTFGRSAREVAAGEDFQADKVVISDSLVLASVVAPRIPGLRTRLMAARRAIAFIERLAEGSRADEGEEETTHENGKNALRLLKATLLLPLRLFPIPDHNEKRREENSKAHEKRKSVLDKESARARRLLNELSRNRAAAEELSSALSRQLFEHTRQPAPEGGAPSPLSILPVARVKTLSPAARKLVLDELSFPEAGVDVPFVVDHIEKANFRLGQELATTFGDRVLDAGMYFLPACGECKPVVVPEPKAENEFAPETRGEVGLVGIQDLLIVRQTLLEYRAGEISHIENILKGEKKSKTHRKLDRTEVTTVQETEKEQLIENELQTTDKYELQSEASRIIQEDRKLEAGVTVTASYGTVDIQAHGSYAAGKSSQESRSSASSFAREVVNRSLQRIRERVLSRLTRTEIAEVEITNLHEFDNQGGGDHVSGVYRWVDKFYEAQIVNYGKRLMLEFMIPEPGAFYRYCAGRKAQPVPSVPKPEAPGFCRNGVFQPLSPADLQPETYLCFVAKYNVKNVTAPSPRYLRVSDILKYKIDSTQGEPVSFAESNDSFKIPEGYAPRAVSHAVSGGNSHSGLTKNDDHDDAILAVVTIADRRVYRYFKNELGKADGEEQWPAIGQVIEWGNPITLIEQQFGSYMIGNLRDEFALPSMVAGAGDPDGVKVSLTGHTTLPMSVAVHYSVLCERSPAKFQQWQIDTFNSIMTAYENLKSDYDDALQNQRNAAEPEAYGRNPGLNREVEKQELKKFSISLLTGQQYESFNAMEEDYRSGIPQINLIDATEEGRFVRFFEQALEWRNMTYVFYPYFWGKKGRWNETLATEDPDPLFLQFLQAGFARVWIPVRPGFELVVTHYVECGGEPWNEKDAPIVGQPDAGSAPTVALIDEIKEGLGADFEFRLGTVRVEKDSRIVRGTGTDFRADDLDREILIALRYYRIAAVEEAAQRIVLREPYAGEDADGIGYAIGAKFYGEPWVVSVPTTLVHLQDGADLISG